MTSKEQRPRLAPGTAFDRYVIQEFVGHGSFGDIYTCQDTKDQTIWAIKLESKSFKKANLEKETGILKKVQNSPFFPKYHDYGENEHWRYLILELLGPSLIGARRISHGAIFSTSTSIRLGIEMLRCIEEFHKHGMLHRDIKPGNFLIRPSRKHPLTLIDFGLSKPYLDDNGEEIPPRENPGFVGTVPYASLNAHNGLELGRCDDLFSWFCVLLKIQTGELPWPTINNKPVVFAAKKETDMAKACEGLPHQYIIIYRLIMSMKREDKPNYDLFYQLLGEAMIETNSSYSDKYDWEKTAIEIVETASKIPLFMPDTEKPELPPDLPSDMKERLWQKDPQRSREEEVLSSENSYDRDSSCGCRIM